MIKIPYEKYLGLPYRHRGRGVDGVDCWGIILLVYKEVFGVSLFDVENYEYNFGAKGADYFIENAWREWIEVDAPEPGAVVLFVNCRGIADHAGICLDNDKYLEACRAGVVVSKLSAKEQTKKYYRLKKHG